MGREGAGRRAERRSASVNCQQECLGKEIVVWEGREWGWALHVEQARGKENRERSTGEEAAASTRTRTRTQKTTEQQQRTRRSTSSARNERRKTHTGAAATTTHNARCCSADVPSWMRQKAGRSLECGQRDGGRSEGRQKKKNKEERRRPHAVAVSELRMPFDFFF